MLEFFYIVQNHFSAHYNHILARLFDFYTQSYKYVKATGFIAYITFWIGVW